MTAPRKPVLVGVIVAVIVLCCGGVAGVGAWYVNTYAPAEHNQAIQELFEDIGPPHGFSPDGPVLRHTLHGRMTAVQQWYSLRCRQGVCPTAAVPSVVAWATRAGTAQITPEYLARSCMDTDCVTVFQRDGFSVHLTIGRHRDRATPATNPEGKVYQVILEVVD